MTDDFLERLAAFDKERDHCLKELRQVARDLRGTPWVAARQHSPTHFTLATNNPSLATQFLLVQVHQDAVRLHREGRTP